MTTTELITLLQKFEKGGATNRPREIKLQIGDKYCTDVNFEFESCGDGIVTDVCFGLTYKEYQCNPT